MVTKNLRKAIYTQISCKGLQGGIKKIFFQKLEISVQSSSPSQALPFNKRRALEGFVANGMS